MKSSRSWKHLGAKMLTCSLFLIVIIKKSSALSNDCTNNTEIGSIRQEIGLLRDENKNQNMEISLLKGMIESQDKTIHQKIIKELDQRMEYDETSMPGHHKKHSSGRARQKRPYRLVPTAPKSIFDENNRKKNENSIRPILNQHQTTSIFYGPPTNCSDLSRLGYTLNGYYLVKRITDTSNNEVTNLETVYCSFKQPEGSINLSTEEKRVGILNFLDGSNKSEPSSSEGNLNTKGRGVIYRNPPRMANLVNDIGKCVSIHGNVSSYHYLDQWDCDPKSKGQLWSWNETSLGSGDRHLCNNYGKCAASRANSPSNTDVLQWDHFDEKGQRYRFLDSPTRPGFYLIKNDHGKCLSIPWDKKKNGAPIHARDCNSSEDGQNWKWNINL